MVSASRTIVVAEPFSPSAIERLSAHATVRAVDGTTPQALLAAINSCEALLVRTRTRVTQEILAQASKLRVIGRAGVGLDNVDVGAARNQGIHVVYTPAASTDSVADLTIGLMIGVLRKITAADAMIRAGRFDEARRSLIGPELSELTIGIVGMGRIGRAVGGRCQRGFGMRVLYNDIVPIGPLNFPAEEKTKGELYALSDIVSLHVPLTPQTRGLIGKDALAGFKPGAMLINTSRGEVVDSDAVAAVLHDGRLCGAGIDVFDREPAVPEDALVRAPNTVLTPHMGARTWASLARMDDVVDDVIRVLEGRKPMYPAWR